MPSKFTCQPPQISGAFRPHQRSFSVQWEMVNPGRRNSQLIQVQRTCVSGLLSHKWDIYVMPLLPRFRDLLERASRKTLRIRDHRRLVRNSVFLTWQDHCSHEPTEAEVAWTRSAQHQASKHTIMEAGGDPKHPTLTEELLIIDSFCVRESVFFKCVNMKVCLAPVDTPNVLHIHSTHGTLWIIQMYKHTCMHAYILTYTHT